MTRELHKSIEIHFFLIEKTKHMPLEVMIFLTQMQNIMLILEMLHGYTYFIFNEKNHSHDAI